MGIALLILKYIGIALLIIIGIALLLVCAVLFCPIRYKLSARAGESYSARAQISWLLFVLRGAVNYDSSDGLDYKIKLFFFTVYPGKVKKAEEGKTDRLNKNTSKNNKNNNKSIEHSKQDEQSDQNKAQEEAVNEELIDSIKIEEAKQEDIDDGSSQNESTDKKGASELSNNKETTKYSIFEKFKYTISSVCDKIKNREPKEESKLRRTLRILNEDRSKRAISNILMSVRRLIKHVLPRKGRCYVHFGFDDPSLTGQVVAIFSIFYPFLYNFVFINPDFEKTVFDGDLYMKGRIRVITLVLIGVKVYFDKDFRYLWKALEL